jgi:hypothetical protein
MKQVVLLVLLVFLTSLGFAQALASNGGPGDEVTVYPNPAVDYIGLTQASAEVREMHVYSLVGKRVKTFTVVDDRTYYIGDLPRGMYLVQFFNPKNEVITTKRLNKQ